MRIGRHSLRRELLGNFCSPDKTGHTTGIALFPGPIHHPELRINGRKHSSLLDTIKHEDESQHKAKDGGAERSWVLRGIAEQLNPHQQQSTPGLLTVQANKPHVGRATAVRFSVTCS